MRLDEIRQKMKEQEIETVLITKPSNFIYAIEKDVSGYLFISQDSFDIVAPRFYRYTLEDFDPLLAFSSEEYEEHLNKMKKKYSKIQVDSNSERIKELLDAEETDLIQEMRRIKDRKEIDNIREACRITDQAIEKIRGGMFSEKTELEVFSEIQRFYSKKGVTDAFTTDGGMSLVQRNCLDPHRPPTKQRIKSEDLVIIDSGCRKNFYCSDVTRTFCESPSEEQQRLFNAVKKIQKEEIEMVRAGQKISDIKKREIELTKELGYKPEENILYSSHALGIEVHEQPTLSHENNEKLEAGMVVTIEPGLHVKGLGGVRIEDTVLVKENGAERLSRSEIQL